MGRLSNFVGRKPFSHDWSVERAWKVTTNDPAGFAVRRPEIEALLESGKAALLAAMGETPRLLGAGETLMRWASRTNTSTSSKAVGLGRGNAEERIAALLIEFRNRLRAIGLPADERYHFPMTQQQIADHTGLTTVRVNRVLRRLREQEMVSVQRGSVIFHHNVAALEELARPLQEFIAQG